MRVVISSGHGKLVRGAEGILDEVDEARRVVPKVVEALRNHGHSVVEYHDDVSTSQQENLDRIVGFHNSQTRDLDVSVHFNAYEPTPGERGVEVLYVSQEELARRVSSAISEAAGFIDRGAKYNSGLAFLNGTEEPAILIEVCFVDAEGDANKYDESFDEICEAIASAIAGESEPEELPIDEVDEPLPSQILAHFSGKCSWFGGPEDMGVSDDEGLAFIFDVEDAPHLFLPKQPEATTGLARRLDPGVFYVACRWDYDVTPKTLLAHPMLKAMVSAGDRSFLAWPADWGPHGDTDRVADLSPGLMKALGISTDAEIEVIYPAPW